MRKLKTHSNSSFLHRWHRPGLVTLFLVSVLVAFFLQLGISNSLATRGGEINKLEREREQLIYELTVQKEEATQLKSLQRVKTEAERAGFKYAPNQFEYLGHLEYALR